MTRSPAAVLRVAASQHFHLVLCARTCIYLPARLGADLASPHRSVSALES